MRFDEFTKNYMPIIGNTGNFLLRNKDIGTEKLVLGSMGRANKGVDDLSEREFADWRRTAGRNPTSESVDKLSPRVRKWAENNRYWSPRLERWQDNTATQSGNAYPTQEVIGTPPDYQDVPQNTGYYNTQLGGYVIRGQEYLGFYK